MPTFSELPGSLGFISEWDTWFKDGAFYNTGIFGSFVSQTQTNGSTNVPYVAMDGYLQLSNSSSSNGSAAVYSFNTIPQTYDAVVIKIDSLTIQQTTVGCHIGISNQKTANNAAPTKVDLALQPMTNKWFVIPLGQYKEQSNPGYLEIYGTVTLKISEIHFINIGKTHPQTVDLDGLLTQTKVVTPSSEVQIITPDEGYLLSSVTVNAQVPVLDKVTFTSLGYNSSSTQYSSVLDTGENKVTCHYMFAGGGSYGCTIGIQGSNNNSSWTTLRSTSNSDNRQTTLSGTYDTYRYYRAYATATRATVTVSYGGMLACAN